MEKYPEQMLVISGDRVPVAAYQAIYHKLTKKTEHIREFFSDAYEITIEDLIQLNEYIVQAVNQYRLDGSRCEPVISLRKNEGHNFSSFEKLRGFNFATSKCTAKLNIEYDFLIILPSEIPLAADIVQRYKIEISLDQDFVEDQESNLPIFVRSSLTGNNITLSTEYTDYAVARALQAAVRDWVCSLSQRKTPAWIRFVDNRADFFSIMVPRFVTLSSLLGVSIHARSAVSLTEVVQFIFLGLSLAWGSFILGSMLIVSFFRQMCLLRPLTFLLLTKGDKDRRTAIKSQAKKKGAFAIFFVTAIILSMAVNVASSLMYDWLF